VGEGFSFVLSFVITEPGRDVARRLKAENGQRGDWGGKTRRRGEGERNAGRSGNRTGRSGTETKRARAGRDRSGWTISFVT
jgi:hypothetical protein